MKFIISTDLDGTLLDHHNYDWQAAKPGLDLCKSLGIPIVLNSSKTFAEVQAIHAELELNSPIVVENGSALILDAPLEKTEFSDYRSDSASDPKTIKFGADRSDILEFISSIRRSHAWKFEGFSDWQSHEISGQTGLSLASAELAAQKQYSEPFVWNDTVDALAEFSSLAALQGLDVLRGGRFYHLQGDTNKAKPLAWLKDNFAKVFTRDKVFTSHTEEVPKLICLGDNHNDIAMLNVADYPVCVKSPVADYPNLSTDKAVFNTVGEGPIGWNEAIQILLKSTQSES